MEVMKDIAQIFSVPTHHILILMALFAVCIIWGRSKEGLMAFAVYMVYNANREAVAAVFTGSTDPIATSLVNMFWPVVIVTTFGVFAILRLLQTNR